MIIQNYNTIITHMSKQTENKTSQSSWHNIHQGHNLQNLSNEQLRQILKELQNEHDIIEAKNQQLATHISDMRTVIKTVEKEKDEEINYTIAKKKKLQDEIERCEAALKFANCKSNTMFADMVAFKELNNKD